MKRIWLRNHVCRIGATGVSLLLAIDIARHVGQHYPAQVFTATGALGTALLLATVMLAAFFAGVEGGVEAGKGR